VDKLSTINSEAPSYKALSVIYFLSGFSALIYQTLWIRKFSLLFGSTVFAMAVIIAVFFCGLAIGSLIFGRISISLKNPVGVYAVLEILIGIYAFLFQWILALAEGIYSGLYLSVQESFAQTIFVRICVAALILALPTILMGGTLPIMTRHFVRELAVTGKRTGLIYGLNAMGAAFGSFITGYILMPNIGVTRTNTIAAIINLIIGIAALVLSKNIKNPSEENEAAVQKRGKNLKRIFEGQYSSRAAALIIVCFAISGFVSMSYEIVWLRYLILFFRDTSYLYTGIITVFVLGIGIGSLIYGSIEHKIRSHLAFLGLLQTGIGIFTALVIYLAVGNYQAIYEAGEKGWRAVLALLFVFLILPTVLMGATFPAVSRAITTDAGMAGNQVGRAYAFNTGGCIIGILAGGFILFSFFGLQNTLYLLFGLNMAVAAILICSDKNFRHYYIGIAPLFLALIFPLVVGLGEMHLPEIILNKKVNSTTEILEVREGATGTAWVTRDGDSVLKLWDDSVVISKGNEGSFLTQGYIPILIAAKIPENVLGLTFGGGLSYYAARLFPEVKSLDFVDISGENIDVAIKHFPENADITNDSRVKFYFDDAYNFLKYGSARYDLILMEPTPPMYSFRTSALYTKEFYEFGRKRMADGGYFVQILPLSNLSEHETMDVMRTFSSIFKYSLLWWNERDCVMIGSSKEIRLDLKEISGRLNRPPIQESIGKYSQKGRYNHIGNLLSGILLIPEDFRKASEVGNIYTDDLPGLEFSSGRNITLDNVERIYSNLSGWGQIKGIFIEFPDFDKYIMNLNRRREYLMTLLYSDSPDVFSKRFLKYINNYSQDKINDLNLLHAYLLRYGMMDMAAEVQGLIGKYKSKIPAN
jgi:spermidine synthase